MTSGIYTIINNITNQVYVGAASNYKSRLWDHITSLRKNSHDNDYLQKSWNKYGEENFKFQLLVECDKEFLYSEENYWCNLLDSHNRKFGYNLKSTHPENKNINTKEISEKIRVKAIGRKWSDEYKQLFRLRKLGKSQSLESIKKITESKYITVYQYDMEGNFIRDWKSAKHVQVELNIKSSNVSVCCTKQGPSLSAGFYRWSYEKMVKLPAMIRRKKLKSSYISKYE